MPASELASQLDAVLRETGELALSYFRSPVKRWFKSDHSPVSEADLAIDRLLRRRLTELAPAAWLSEESEDDLARLDAEQIWIVDPIDGTRAFLHGGHDWGISVALVAGRRPILAGIFVPVDNEMFLAVSGKGATRNGAAVAVNDGTEIAGARVAGPRADVEKLIANEPRAVATPKIHSLALRIARVAQGAIDIALASAQAADWDLAAADLLVHEARGTLTTLQGHPLNYNCKTLTHGSVVAAGPSRQQSLLTLMRR